MYSNRACPVVETDCLWARIVIVAYRNGPELQNCIDALAAQTINTFEVVVVNNACPKNSTSNLRLPDHRFFVLEAGANLGFAGGTNLGARGARTKWLITLNPDALPKPQWLEELKRASARYPNFDILSSTLLQASNPARVDGFGDVLSGFGIAWSGGRGMAVSELPEHDAPVFGACGAAAAYRREVFVDCGGFDEAFFCYLEDIDLAFRLQAAGYACLQVRHALVVHLGGASSAGDRGFPIYQTYKNNLRLIIRNAPPLLLPVMVLSFLLAQAYIIGRNSAHPDTRYRLAGFRDSLSKIGSAIRSRRQARRLAKLGSFEMMKRLVWSLKALKHARVSILSIGAATLRPQNSSSTR